MLSFTPVSVSSATLGRGVRDVKTEAVKAQAEIQARTSTTTEPTDGPDDHSA